MRIMANYQKGVKENCKEHKGNNCREQFPAPQLKEIWTRKDLEMWRKAMHDRGSGLMATVGAVCRTVMLAGELCHCGTCC